MRRTDQLRYGFDGFTTTKAFAEFTETEELSRQALMFDSEKAKAARYLGYLCCDLGSPKDHEPVGDYELVKITESALESREKGPYRDVFAHRKVANGTLP